MSRKAFREVRMLDETYWVHTQVLDVNKLGKARVVICHDNKDLRGRTLLSVYKQALLRGSEGDPMLQPTLPHRHLL